jgi:hypothetical protein
MTTPIGRLSRLVCQHLRHRERESVVDLAASAALDRRGVGRDGAAPGPRPPLYGHRGLTPRERSRIVLRPQPRTPARRGRRLLEPACGDERLTTSLSVLAQGQRR